MTQPFFLPPGFRATDGDDNPLAGGYYLFFAGGTTTPKTVYSDAALSSALGSQVNLNSSGTPVAGDGTTPVLIYPGTGTYKIQIYDADDTLIATFDNVPGAEAAAEEITSAAPETPVLSKTAAYAVTINDRGSLFNLNPTGGTFAVTLPSAVAAGDDFRVGFRHNGTANQAAIVTTLSQSIKAHKAVTSYPLSSLGETVWLVSDGADWIVDTYVPPLMKANLPYIVVLDRLASPPVSPNPGDRYLINATPTGVWATLGFADTWIAEADGNGSWIGYVPQEGWLAHDADESILLQFRGSAWVALSNIAAPASSTLQTAVFEHQETNGTAGGMATADAWTKRTLNTSVQNDIDGCSIASSVITLAVGKYLINFSQFLWSDDIETTGARQDSRIKVTSGTAMPDPIKGIAGHDTSGMVGENATWSGNFPFHGMGILTVTEEADIELQYFHDEGGNDTGELGIASTEAAAGVEIYARVVILSLTSLQGPKGDQGTKGEEGLDAAYYFQHSTATSGDPGTGKIRTDNATPASVTEIAVSETDAAGADLSDVIASWDDSTSTTAKARIRWHKEGAPQNFFEFRITGAGTDQGAYWTFPVAYVGDGGTIANGNDCAVSVMPLGDKGDPGTTVPDISGLAVLPLTTFDRKADKLIVYDASTLAHNAFFIPRMAVDVTHPTFGATGDGSTDDTAAIQSAIDHLRDAGGGTVWFPAGNYKLVAPYRDTDGIYTGYVANDENRRANKALIIYDCENIELVGEPGTIFDRSADTIADTIYSQYSTTIYVSKAKNITIRGIELRGAQDDEDLLDDTKTTTSGDHIQINNGSERITLADLIMQDGTTGITLGLNRTSAEAAIDPALDWVRDVTVRNVEVRNCEHDMVMLAVDGLNFHDFRGKIWERADASVGVKQRGLYFHSCKNVHGTGVHLSGAFKTAILVADYAPVTACSLNGLSIRDMMTPKEINDARGSAINLVFEGHGISLQTDNCQGLSFENFKISNVSSGVQMPGVGMHDVSFRKGEIDAVYTGINTSTDLPPDDTTLDNPIERLTLDDIRITTLEDGTNYPSVTPNSGLYIDSFAVDSGAATIRAKNVHLNNVRVYARNRNARIQNSEGTITNCDFEQNTGLAGARNYDMNHSGIMRLANNRYGNNGRPNGNQDVPTLTTVLGYDRLETRLSAITNDTTFVCPARYAIENIFLRETAGNAITGGLKLGTTTGATDIVAALTVGANFIGHVPDADLLLRFFSVSANQTVFVQDVTAWNSASIDMTITMRKVM